VSPFRPFLPPQSDVYPKVLGFLPSLPTTHDRIVFSLSTLTAHSSSPFIFILLRIPFPTTPLFSHPYKTPGVWGLFPFGFSRITGHESQVTHARFFTSHRPRVTSHAFSSACRLFGIPKKVNSFAIKQIQPLFAKHPGYGVPPNAAAGCGSPWGEPNPTTEDRCAPEAPAAKRAFRETFLQPTSYIDVYRHKYPTGAVLKRWHHVSFPVWEGETSP
jgi:hypothetical protein